jgi:hypothetical protein
MLRVGGRCVPGGGLLRRLLPAAELHCSLVRALRHLVTSMDSLGLLVMGVVVGRCVGPLRVLRLEPVLGVIFELDFVQAVRHAAVGE